MNALTWLLLTLLGAAATCLLVETSGRWLLARFRLPPLTIPFDLVTCLLLTLAQALPSGALPLAPIAPLPPADPIALLLPLGVVRGFAQVFLCSSLPTAALALAAVAAASPLAALLGLAGGLASSLSSLALGMDPAAVMQGLGSYNGVLCAIAIGGIFHAPMPASLLLAVLTAAFSALLASPLTGLLGNVGLPPLTSPFLLAMLLVLPMLRSALPALLPVALHATQTPEEHRRRYRVARMLLGEFRLRLARALRGERSVALLPQASCRLRQHLDDLFTRLDRDGDGRLGVEEFRDALATRNFRVAPGLLPALLDAMDLNRDGQVDRAEFSELMLRLRQLIDSRRHLFTYLQPADADGDARIDPDEFDRMLRSVGQRPLQAEERQWLFGGVSSLSWVSFLDRLLFV